MAMLKYGYAAVSTPIVDQGKWLDKKASAGRIIVAKNVVAKYDPSQWLLSHVTIIASVDVDLADPKDKKSNYLIKPEYSIFVNNNGDSWERNLLKACYKTFLGADNFVEHVQIPELSKGKIIDVAMREIPFTKDNEGKDLTTLYVDILIATNRKHSDIVEKITNGEYGAVSMGCLIKFSQCSQCGRIAEDESKACQHVRFYKNNYFYDKSGVKRIIAELCGRAEDPESCRFIDASWVRKPAFEGAVLRNIVQPDENIAEKIQKAVAFPSFKAEPGMVLRSASAIAKAATELVSEIEAQEAAPPAPPPKDDAGFPPAPPGGQAPPPTDPLGGPGMPPPAPGGDPLAMPPPAPGGDPLAMPPAGGAPPPAGGMGAPAAPGMPGVPGTPGAQPPAAVQDPAAVAMVGEIQKLVTQDILNKIKKNLSTGESYQEKQENRPKEPENASNSSFVKDANLEKLLTSSKKYANNRLLNGLLILSNIKDWREFKKYGYDRKDVLGMLYYIDKTLQRETVGADAVKALSKVKLASGNLKGFFTEMILEIGRKPYKKEALKLASWGKILSYFD